jgi:ankyrin repeat protein
MKYLARRAAFLCYLAILPAFALTSHASDLHQAVTENDLTRLSQLLDHSSPEINVPDSNHMTPLNLAAHLGRTDATRLLLEAGADVTIGDADNSVPLHLAAIGGHTDIMQLLTDNGADLDAQDDNGNNAMIHAIQARQTDAALWLIEHGASVLLANEVGDSPLHWAIARHYQGLVRRLIEAGADINQRTTEGNTPLSYAVLVSDTGLARLLINQRADIELKNNWGRTPLSQTARETGNVEMLNLLIASGAQVNALDRFDDTPLILAAWKGFRAVVNILLDNGAILPAEEDQLRELVVYAASAGMARLFDSLVAAGADLEFESRTGGSVLHDAACGTSAKIVASLLELGKDINAIDLYGRTPLHYAAERGRVEVVRHLLSQGAAVDARSLSGRTALNLAFEYGRDSVVAILKKAGAASADIKFPELTGPYLGQSPPGSEPKLFAPDIVSTHKFEHGCVTFSPDGREAFWTTSIRPADSGHVRTFIMTSRVENGSWTLPKAAGFSSPDSRDDVPFFAPDGNRLYFLSRRGPFGIWYIERDGGSWSEPHHIEGGPSSNRPYWQFSVSANGAVYTGAGGDVWVSRPTAEGYSAPETLDRVVATDRHEGHPCIAPDESFLIYQILDEENTHESCLYISFKDSSRQWTTPVQLETGGKPLRGMCPVLSPDGTYLFFNAWRNITNDIYWVEIGSVIDSLSRLSH